MYIEVGGNISLKPFMASLETIDVMAEHHNLQLY